MHVTFAPRNILQIDEARIIYRNFAGVGSKFNREGDRNFAVVIPDQEIADALINEGWNVKIKPAREEDDAHGYLTSGRAKNRLDEASIDILDNIDILNVDLDVRPYDWEVNGKTGRTAYLQAIHVTQKVDRFAEDFN